MDYSGAVPHKWCAPWYALCPVLSNDMALDMALVGVHGSVKYGLIQVLFLTENYELQVII